MKENSTNTCRFRRDNGAHPSLKSSVPAEMRRGHGHSQLQSERHALRALIVWLFAALHLCAVVASANQRRTDTAHDDRSEQLRFERVELTFEAGRFHVLGDLLIPPSERETLPVVVYVWGSGPSDRQAIIASSRALREFLNAGFAVFVFDKPGCGGSTGEFSNAHLLEERARIAVAGIERISAHPRVDEHMIGLFGSSQAAYVMPMIFEASEIAFLIAWSCPMENAVEQGAYQVEQYLLCAGKTIQESRATAEVFRTRESAVDFESYRSAAITLDAIPEIRDDLGFGGVLPRERFLPPAEALIDPRDGFADLTIPTLAIYGALDRNIDPRQGAAAFEAILARAGNRLSSVQRITGADHNMVRTPDGCVQHQLEAYSSVPGAHVAEEFYTVVADWLSELKIQLLPTPGPTSETNTEADTDTEAGP